MSVCCSGNENTTATTHIDVQLQVSIKPPNLTTASEKENREKTTYIDSTNNHAVINESYPWDDINQHWALINSNVRPYMNGPEYFKPIQLENENDVCLEENISRSYHSMKKHFLSVPFSFNMSASLYLTFEYTNTHKKTLPSEFSDKTVLANITSRFYTGNSLQLIITHASYVSKTFNYTECYKMLLTKEGSIKFIFSSIRSKYLSLLEISLDLNLKQLNVHKCKKTFVNQDVVVQKDTQTYLRSSDMIKTSFSNESSKRTAICTIKHWYEDIFSSNKSKTKTETTFQSTPFSNFSVVNLTKQIGNLKVSSYNNLSYNRDDYHITSLFEETSPGWFRRNETYENRTCKTNNFKTKSGETENISNSTECVADIGYYWQILTCTKTPHVVVWTETSEYENRDESVNTNLYKTEWLKNSITQRMFIVKTPLFTSIQQTSMTVSPDSVIVVNTSNIYTADYVTAEHYKSNATRIQNLYTSTGQPASTVNSHPATDNGSSANTKAFELDQVFLQPASRYYKLRMLFTSSEFLIHNFIYSLNIC